MTDIQVVTVTNNNAQIELEFAQSLSTNIAVHNTDINAHYNIVESLNAEIDTKANSDDIPTRVSELENDADYATVSQIPTIPTNVSTFANDAGYATTTQVSTKASTTLNNINQASALANLGFAGQSLTTNGYYKLPGGLILQWGHISSLTSSSQTMQTINFPISFPNSCINVITQVDFTNSSASAVSYYQVSSMNTSYFTCTYTVNRYWIAIGY